MNKKPKYSKKSAYDLSGPGLKGWAALADAYHKRRREQMKREIERRKGKGPYEC